ncbi:hypothetical protein E5K02_19985 [Hymenobacter metallicola]|uniref:Outer membrane protein beta-barrel domain-containing protein n=1 Tax=Hymenobacter metallicola TaxID=2563114 RepID=A0A4Z0Q1R1_9BACT|nr:hypothetical protein E5K02_19985 [Hymenobacter metallicola]
MQAAYGNYANSIGRPTYQGGLRVEQTNTHGPHLPTSQQVGRSYRNLFSNAILACEVS